MLGVTSGSQDDVPRGDVAALFQLLTLPAKCIGFCCAEAGNADWVGVFGSKLKNL